MKHVSKIYLLVLLLTALHFDIYGLEISKSKQLPRIGDEFSVDMYEGVLPGKDVKDYIFIPGSGSNVKIYGNLMAYYPYGLPWADWQGSDRWLYGGKEFEREHGLHTYDFHARTYDPGLGRFTAPDPLATSNRNVNPFVFCSADPVNRIDPTGERDYFTNKGEFVYHAESEPNDRVMYIQNFGSFYPVLMNNNMLLKGNYIIISKEITDKLDQIINLTDTENIEYGFNILQDGNTSEIATGNNGVITAEEWIEANKGIDISSIRTNVHTHNRKASDDGRVFGLAFPSKRDIATAGTIDIVIGTYITDSLDVEKIKDLYDKMHWGITFYNKSGPITPYTEDMDPRTYKSMDYEEFKKVTDKINEYKRQ